MKANKFKRKVIEYIQDFCAQDTDIDFNDFDITFGLEITRHYVGGAIEHNGYDLRHVVRLCEKNEKYHFALYSDVDPKHVAQYALAGYKAVKEEYEESSIKRTEENKNNKWQKNFLKNWKMEVHNINENN